VPASRPASRSGARSESAQAGAASDRLGSLAGPPAIKSPRMGHRSRRRLVALTLLGLAWQLSPGFGLRDGVASAATCSEGVAWVRQMASSQQLALAGMAATPDGGVAVAVTFKGELSFTGLQPESPPLSSGGGSASLLLKLSSTGALAWMRHL